MEHVAPRRNRNPCRGLSKRPACSGLSVCDTEAGSRHVACRTHFSIGTWNFRTCSVLLFVRPVSRLPSKLDGKWRLQLHSCAAPVCGALQLRMRPGLC